MHLRGTRVVASNVASQKINESQGISSQRRDDNQRDRSRVTNDSSQGDRNEKIIIVRNNQR